MFRTLALLALLSGVAALPVRMAPKDGCSARFEEFKVKHGKEYGSAKEHNLRLQAFCENLKEIDEINARPGITWTAGVNKYSDMSWEEFRSYYTMPIGKAQNCSATGPKPVSEMVPWGLPPAEKDWRNATCGETSCISMVKDQGKCGSCWTFSTVGALESIHAIKTGMMVLLSEQQLIDCAADFENHGCNGGLPSQAFEYILYGGGLERMEDYPYVCGDGHCVGVGGPCKADSASPAFKPGASVSAVVNFTGGDERSMMTVIGLHNPVSVAFEVVPDLRFYSSGVYSSAVCNNTEDSVNHAVLAVGYGTEGGKDFWIIKNSWSEAWGDHGYFKIERGLNMCGIATCASFPITKDVPTPPSQHAARGEQAEATL